MKFKLTSKELSSGIFRVQYNTARNVYVRGSGVEEENNIKGWKEGSFDCRNIQHKTEHDWKMCYLARTENSNEAFIEWFFELSVMENMPHKSLESISATLAHACYESGSVKWTLYWPRDEIDSNKFDQSLVIGQNDSFISEELPNNFSIKSNQKGIEISRFLRSDLVSFKIRADLSSGSGNLAWQHTQLFRQSLNDKNAFLFDVCFRFE